MLVYMSRMTALLLLLPAVSLAQQIAIGGYPLPTAQAGPEDITSGPDGALWFTEGVGDKIGRITTAGTLTEYPLPGPNKGPYTITTGPDGALWFTEYTGKKIGRITTSGVISEYATPFGSPQGITTGPDGALWFTEYTTNRIGRITTAGVATDYLLPTPNNDLRGSPQGQTAHCGSPRTTAIGSTASPRPGW